MAQMANVHTKYFVLCVGEWYVLYGTTIQLQFIVKKGKTGKEKLKTRPVKKH